MKGPCDHPCHRLNKALRRVMGPIWVLDVEDIFGVNSTRAVERIVDTDKFHKGQHGTFYPGRSRAHKRGENLPDDSRLARTVKLARERVDRNGYAARALELPLWEVVDTPLILSGGLRHIAGDLSAEVRQIVFHEPGSNAGEALRRRPLNRRSVLEPLVRAGSVDALAALLGLAKEVSWSRDSMLCRRVTDAAIAVFLQLAAHPPFYEAREAFFGYLKEHFFVPPPRRVYFPLDAETVARIPADIREFLCLAGELRLIGSTFREQTRLTYYYRESRDRDKVVAAAKEVRDKIRRSALPVTIRPRHPLYVLLKRAHHPSVRLAESLVLPWKRHSQTGFRIANALESITTGWLDRHPVTK